MYACSSDVCPSLQAADCTWHNLQVYFCHPLAITPLSEHAAALDLLMAMRPSELCPSNDRLCVT